MGRIGGKGVRTTVLFSIAGFTLLIYICLLTDTGASFLNARASTAGSSTNRIDSAPHRPDGIGGGEDFPHWQIMTNRQEGVTRQAVMRHEYYCAAVMNALGDAAAAAAVEGEGATSSPADGSIAVSCEWNYPSIVRLSSSSAPATSFAVPLPSDGRTPATSNASGGAEGGGGETAEGESVVAVVGIDTSGHGSLVGALEWWPQSIAQRFLDESGLNISDTAAVGDALAALMDAATATNATAEGGAPPPSAPPQQRFSAQQLSALRRLLAAVYVPSSVRLTPRTFHAVVTAVYEYSYYYSTDLAVGNVLWRGDSALSSAEAVYTEALVGRPQAGPIAGGWMRKGSCEGGNSTPSTASSSPLPHHYSGSESMFASVFGHVPTRAERTQMHSTLRGMSGGGGSSGSEGSASIGGSASGERSGSSSSSGIPFAALPLRVPRPIVLAALAPSSPLLFHLQLHETINLFGDDLPRAATAHTSGSGLVGANSAPTVPAALRPPMVMNVKTASQWAEVSQKGPTEEPLPTIMTPPANKDMHSRYVALAGDVEAVRRGFGGGGGSSPRHSSSFSPQKRPLHTDGKIASLSDNFRSQQYAVAVRDRLVRLGPTLTPHYQEVIREGMLSVQRDKINAAAGNYKGNKQQSVRQAEMNKAQPSSSSSPSPPLLGLLSDAPSHVGASLVDALSGTWNVSALPPWLVVPSAVNTRECFENSVAPLSDSPSPSSLTSGGGRGGSGRGKGVGRRRKSLLILGPSYGRNVYSQLCLMHTGTMVSSNANNKNNNSTTQKKTMAAADVNALCRLTNGHQGGYQMLHRKDVAGDDYGNNDGDDQPFVVGYSWFALDIWESFDRLIANLFKELAEYTPTPHRMDATTTAPSTPLPLPSLLPPPDRSIAKEMLKYYPHFTQRALADGEEDGAADAMVVGNQSRTREDVPRLRGSPRPHRRTFRFSDFIARYHRVDMDRLKGLFTHVLFMPGAWQKAHGDTTMPEQTEANAMTIDLIAELLAPTEKIIVSTGYNWFSTHQQDAAGEAFQKDFFDPNSVGEGGVSGCNHKFREHKFRDAVVCGASEGGRGRVRQAAADHLGGLMRSGGVAYATDVGSVAEDGGNTNSGRSPSPSTPSTLPSSSSPAIAVEVFDPYPRLSAPFAYLDMCLAGNHPLSHVLEALLQTLLREHVCPPRYAMAVPEGDPSLYVGGGSFEAVGGEGGDHHRHLASTATPYASYRKKRDNGTTAATSIASVPLVNYAMSGLPAVFPDFAKTHSSDVDRKKRTLIRFRQTPQSHYNMPSLIRDARDGSYTIVDLFPLTKVPLAEVAEGVCRAIFDSPYAELSAVTRVVRRRREYGVGVGRDETVEKAAGSQLGRELVWATYPNHSSFPSPSSEEAQSKPPAFFVASPVDTYFPLNDGHGSTFVNMSGDGGASPTPFSPLSPSLRFLGTPWPFNPFVVCTQCMPFRSRRFYVPLEESAAQAALAGYTFEAERRRLASMNLNNSSRSSDGDDALLLLVQQPFPMSLADPANAAISHPLHPSTAHSNDPLYMLRTLGAFEGGRCTCKASRYMKDPKTGSQKKGGGKKGKNTNKKDGGGNGVGCPIGARYPGLPFPFSANAATAKPTLAGPCGPAPMEELMARMTVWAYLARGIGRERGRPL